MDNDTNNDKTIEQLRIENAELREVLTGLLALTRKMFGYAQESARRGLTTLSPKGVEFYDLKFAEKARKILGLPEGD